MEKDESITIDVKQPSTFIPNENIYKIHLLNEKGIPSHVFVFCAGLRSHDHLSEIFSEIEISYYKEKDIVIVFSKQLIHKDDTMRTIKYKIIKEILEFSKKHKQDLQNVSVEELYLFALQEKYVNMEKLYQQITQDDVVKLTKERFFQYATNISADPYVLDDGSKKKGGLYNDIFTFEQWMELGESGKKELFIPLGMEFQNSYDFMFTTNPYKHQLWTETIRYSPSQKNPLLNYEKSLLLDYTNSKNIMVCLAKDVFQYAEEMNINTEYMTELYYPFLYKLGLTSSSLLNESSLKLAQETEQVIHQRKFERKNFVQKTYREIYWSKEDNEEMPYIENGISEFSITISSGLDVNFPLDLIFRKLHSNDKIPFIKYNPGTRKENMYRLYSNKVSHDGKKIPLLNESLIMRMSREIGKSKQISLFLKEEVPLFVHIHQHGSITIESKMKIATQMELIDDMLQSALKPFFTNMNNILQPLGYNIQEYSNVYGNNVESVLLNYKFTLPILSKISLSSQMEYITPIFNVFSSDVSKGAVMRFKQVRNFKEMNARTMFIREIYDKTGSSEEVVSGLMNNFDLDEKEAILAFAEFRSQHQLLKQKVIENPGFETIFQMKSLKNELVVEMKDINSPHYISELHVYIDTILRMSQKPKSIGLSSTLLKKFKTKPRDKKEEVEDIDIVVNAKSDLTELYKPEREEIQEEEEAAGIEFDDYEFYQDYDEDEEGDEEEGDDEDESAESPESVIGGKQTNEEDEEDDTLKTNIDNMPIKNPSPFFRKMRELDPVLFVTEESSKFPLYSKACPSGDKRQPIILTDEEKKRIDQTNPGSYGNALYYGSAEDKKHWYICPRYWCLKTNSSISEKDVLAGKCGNIIPRNASRVPPGAYVYEFNNPKNHMKDGKYVQHVPGFLKKKVHPNGLCVPCCFGKAWDSKDQVTRRQECDYEEKSGKTKNKERKSKITTKSQSYIISSVNYPLPQNRWGYMPVALQLFLKSDANRVVDPKNNAFVVNGEKALLRYGVEKSENQSFLACFAYFYAWKQRLESVPTIEEMRELFVDAITIDMFITYHNGNLVSIFKPKDMSKFSIDIDYYSESEFYKTINLKDDIQVDYLEETIASYQNFLLFMKDETSVIDHTYLWDFFCYRNNSLLKDGMNLIILQLKNTDITESVQFICPSNAYSSAEFDDNKETAIIVKQDNFYEPIHLYEQMEKIVQLRNNTIAYTFEKGDYLADNKVYNKNNQMIYKLKAGETNSTQTTIKKTFVSSLTIPEIKDTIKLIKYTKKKYCGPMPSMPKVYKFQHAMNVNELIRILKLHHYQIKGQILNYKNKVIGIQVHKEEEQSLLFVPCYPSSMLKNLPSKYMDNMEIWLDYNETLNRLNVIYNDTNGKIMCKPSLKILEDGLIVGFLTQTNQFIQINPPSEPINKDNIPQIAHSGYNYNKENSADITLTTKNEEENKRLQTILNIELETQFYNIFRSMVRMQLNLFEKRELRKEIIGSIDDPYISYRGKMKIVQEKIKNLMNDHVDFKEIGEKELKNVENIVMCDENTCGSDESPVYCISSDEGKCVSLFPKNHLISGFDNEKLYFERMSDELIRNTRSKLFMFHPKNYMNITNIEYNINNNELFLLESKLSRDYFRNLIPYGSGDYFQNITYDTAQPDDYNQSVQNYTSKMTLGEQVQLLDTEKDDGTETQLDNFIIDCIDHTKANVIGNLKIGSWRKIFPSNAKEIVFKNTPVCSFIPIIYLYQQVYQKTISVKNIKMALWKGYSDILKSSIVNIDKIVLFTLKQQGKKELMEKIRTKRVNLESIVMSDEYYISDLDWWVFCTTAKLPVILFSSTSLKPSLPSVNWLRLATRNIPDDKYYFVRSTASNSVNVPKTYHVIQAGYSLNDLNDTKFIQAERGSSDYSINVQTIMDYFSSKNLITK